MIKNAKLEIFAQFIAGIAIGGIIISVGDILNSKTGFYILNYHLVTVTIRIIGVLIGIFFARKIKLEPKKIIIISIILIFIHISTLLLIDYNFYKIAAIFNALISPLVPSAVLVIAINWRKFSTAKNT